MKDRSRELVPGSWNMVKERTLTTGLSAKGWCSEHSAVCRIFCVAAGWECKGEEGLKGRWGKERLFV